MAGESTEWEFRQSFDVHMASTNTTFHIASNALIKDGGKTFFAVEPSRFRPIASLLVSQCGPDARKLIAKSSNFWTNKNGKGRLFLDELRRARQAACKSLYKVVGARFTTRKKHHRCKQIVADHLDVLLPICAGQPALAAAMKVDITGLRKNGKSRLWVEMTPNVVEHLTRLAAARLNDATSADSGANESDHGEGSSEVDDDLDDEVDGDDVRQESQQSGDSNDNVNVDDNVDANVNADDNINESSTFATPPKIEAQRSKRFFPIFKM